MSGRRLLILAPYFPPENTSGAARPDRFARYLRQLGWSVAVIARALPGHEPSPDVTRVSEAGEGMVSGLLALLQRWLLPYDERLPWAAAAAGAIRARWRRVPPEVLLSTHPPAAAHLAALLVKRWSGVPWVADFRDPLWGNPFRNRRRTRVLDPVLERLIIGSADAVIANTDAMRDLFRARYPAHAGKIHLIWNGYDPADGLVARPPAARRRRVICHAGTLYGGRTPAAVAESLARLLATGRVAPGDVELRLVGPADAGLVDPARAPYRALHEAGCLAFDGVQVTAARARDEMLDADILLLLDNNASNAGLQVPAKLFDYVRAGRPIFAITARGSPSARLLEMSGAAFAAMAPDDSCEAIDAVMERWLTDPPAARPMGEAFRLAFDGSAQAESLINILCGVRR